jgi:hypothetical protein
MSVCRIRNDIGIQAFPGCSGILSPEIVDRRALKYDEKEVKGAEQHHNTHYYPYRDRLAAFNADSEEEDANACFEDGC